MVQFLSILVQTARNNNIELTIFLNGAFERERFQEWIHDQNTKRKNINSVSNVLIIILTKFIRLINLKLHFLSLFLPF